jgi:RNA polymerase sigma-70 factor (ECF subfamily)
MPPLVTLYADAHLTNRFHRGDSTAFAEFVAQHRGELLGFIQKRMSDALRKRVEPEDILQDLSIGALQSLSDADTIHWDPLQWVYSLAERRIIDAHRKHFGAQKRAAGREAAKPSGPGAESWSDLLADTITSPSAALTQAEKELQMLQALETLPPDAREALKLRYVEGLPSKEIAARLGRTDGAVRVLLTRSLQKLQEILSHNADFQTLLARRM